MKFFLQTHRIYCQIVSAVLVCFPFLNSWTKLACVPALHCYSCPLAAMACPIGTIQYFLLIGAFPFIALGTLILVGALVGRLTCFYVCPFGFLQDILFTLHRAVVDLPRWCEAGKYVSLIGLVFIATLAMHHPMFCKLCPAGILEAGIPVLLHAKLFEPVIVTPVMTMPNPILEMAGLWFWIKLTIALSFLAVAVVVRRPFCRIMCPAGAIFSILSRLTHCKKALTCTTACVGGCNKRKIN